MRIPARLIPEPFLQAYKLHPKIYNGYLYMEIRKGMYGLPQSGIIANQLLKKTGSQLYPVTISTSATRRENVQID